MSNDVVAKPQSTAAGESKSARKKKAKAEAAATVVSAPDKPSSDVGAGASEHAGKTNGVDLASDHAYIKELNK
jgi:hypothetical protein